MKKSKNTKDLHKKLWAYFLGFAFFIMIMIWCLQIFFLGTYYSAMKGHQIISYGDEISSNFIAEEGIDENFKEKIYNVCFSNGISARIFDGNGTLIYSPEIHMFKLGFKENIPEKDIFEENNEDGKEKRLDRRPQDGFLLKYNEITRELKEKGTEYVLKQYNDPYTRSAQILYVRRLEGADGTVFYLSISTMLAPVDITGQILQNQLIFITIISLIVAFILSYFFAKNIAKPIVSMTRSAKKLAEGDYSVCFEGSTYTEIDDLANVLNNTAAELSKTDTLRRDLMANVSHDLRTPLTIIKSYAEMIRDLSGNNPEKRETHTQVIIDEADRLTTLVNDILDLSRLEAGTADINPCEMNLSRQVKEIINRFEVFEETEGFVFEQDIEDEVYVIADEHSMSQVIYNLISNGLNYTGDDKKISISLKAVQGKAKFEVRDTGKGIAPEEIDLVWQRYYRASESHKRTKIGTGIGLSIVKNILENYKAEFGVESRQGEGSVFWFTLDII